MRKLFLSLTIILCAFFLQSTYAQIDTSLTVVLESSEPVVKLTPYSKLILPAALISYGVATRIAKPLQTLDHSVAFETGEYNKQFIIDDYIQYTSYAAVYGLDLVGIKAKHNVVDRTIVLATSCLISAAVVQTTKRVTNVQRPDGADEHSFPSGHTATAFLGAHLLFREYKEASPWIGIVGYTVATATGTMRILNKKHWFSDVVTGAGVGIASVELGYLLLPVWQDLFGLRENSLVIVPTVSFNNVGAGLVYTF
jgi:membrane-associated phospholipid phosphatase